MYGNDYSCHYDDNNNDDDDGYVYYCIHENFLIEDNSDDVHCNLLIT